MYKQIVINVEYTHNINIIRKVLKFGIHALINPLMPNDSQRHQQ
jgi:hypothetical protein